MAVEIRRAIISIRRASIKITRATFGTMAAKHLSNSKEKLNREVINENAKYV